MKLLAQYIASNSLRQNQLAADLGISDAYLSQILKKLRRPSYDVMCRIALVTDNAVPLEAWASEPSAEDAA